jgi:hypothetical protein
MGVVCRFVTHPEPDDEIAAPESAPRRSPQGTGVAVSAFRPVERRSVCRLMLTDADADHARQLLCFIGRPGINTFLSD